MMPEVKLEKKKKKKAAGVGGGGPERTHYRNMSFQRNVKADYYACFVYEPTRSGR